MKKPFSYMFIDCILLSNVLYHTGKVLEFKHASQ